MIYPWTWITIYPNYFRIDQNIFPWKIIYPFILIEQLWFSIVNLDGFSHEMGFSWDFHGGLIRCSWDFNGGLMGFSWDLIFNIQYIFNWWFTGINGILWWFNGFLIIYIKIYIYIYGQYIFIYLTLVGCLEHEFYDFPFSWEFHNPHWRTHSWFTHEIHGDFP